MQDQARNSDIHFGTSFIKHLIRVWNLHITHPFLDIFLWDDEVSGAYRIPKYNPAVAGDFDYAIIHVFFRPTGDTFGSNTIPAEHKPLSRARAFLAKHLSRDEPLVMKHAEILNLVDFAVESEPSNVVYTQSTPDNIHKGVYDSAQAGM